MDATLMIEPPPCSTMPGITALIPRNTPRWLTEVTRSHSRSSASIPADRT